METGLSGFKIKRVHYGEFGLQIIYNPFISLKQTLPPPFHFSDQQSPLPPAITLLPFPPPPCDSRRRTAAAAAANDGEGLVSGVGPRTHCGSPLCSLFSPSRPHFLRPATNSDDQAISRRRPPPARQARWDSNSGDSFLSISTLFPRFGRCL